MTDGGQERRRFVVARRARERPRTYRVDSSIRMPWGAGLLAFLVLAVVTALLVGRTNTGKFKVPQALLDYQQQISRDAAQSVRRGLNAGVADLDGLGRVVNATGASDSQKLTGALAALRTTHRRYKSLYCVDGNGKVIARDGGEPHAGQLDPRPPFSDPGTQKVHRASDGSALIQEYAPFKGGCSIVGEYDPGFLTFSLQSAQPGDAWVVDSRNRVIGSLNGAGSFSNLPSDRLRTAGGQAARGTTGAQATGGSIDHQQVIGYAPVNGRGPGGNLGLGVVTVRDVNSFALPQTDSRREALLVGAVLAVLALLIFGWLYIIVFVPILKLQRETERVAYGDLGKSVEVVRYDEVGLAARALERIRILLIRRRTQEGTQDSGDDQTTRRGPTPPG